MKKDRGKTAVFSMRDVQKMKRLLSPRTPQAQLEYIEETSKPGYRYLHEVLPQGAWKGRRCWIVAGGPSIKGMDLGFLQGELVIGINRAFEICDPTVLLCMDQRFWGWVVGGELGEETRKRFDAFRGIKCWAMFHLKLNVIPPDECYFLRSNPGVAIGGDLKEGIHWGCHGGYAAVNLAILLGASPIYLLGYDMNTPKEGKKEEKVWWHNGYPNDGQKPDVYKRFINDFVVNKGAFKQCGSDIVNLNPHSGLGVFRKSTVEEEGITFTRKPLVVSFHTNSEYERIAREMEKSVKRFGFEVEVSRVESRGSWLKNAQYKAEFIRDKLKEKKRDILWLDADSIVNSCPDLFINFEGDIGVHICDWKEHTGGRRDQRELLGAVMYCRYNERVEKVLDAWVAAVAKEPMKFEQLTLQHLLEDWPKESGLVVEELPASYCKIFDTMADVENPVIEQFQASRLLRVWS